MSETSLSSIADLLTAHGWNYSVFLREYVVALTEDAVPESLVSEALQVRAVLESLRRVTPSEVVAEIRTSLTYAGDVGAGPDPSVFQSDEFDSLLSDVLRHVAAVAERSTKIEQFRFVEGHPAYPVFWDFAFLFYGANENLVLIGSSSD